jgi:taurine dioxygenase
MTYDKIQVKPLTTALGAEIGGVDLSQPLDNETMDEIHRAFLEYLVIFFHDQHITPEQHIAFSRHFGALNIHPFVEAMPGHPEILEVLKEPDDVMNFGGLWHIDLTFLEKPPLGSILYAKEIPDAGGDTLWTNLYLAYDALSDGMRDMLDGLIAIHSAVKVYGPEDETNFRDTKTSMQLDQTEQALDIVEHPLVRTHPDTGRKGLYLGGASYLRRFEDMTEEESQPLIQFLAGHATQPQFTCRFRWAENAIAFWDNRCTQHFALNDYHGQRRLMHRTTIDGDRPV